MGEVKRIGIDLDNTLINYDGVFRAFATERGLVAPELAISKLHVRTALRALPEGDLAWQRLQGAVYGRGVRDAVLFDGADAFLRLARERRCEVFVVSHKTEFGHHDPERINLRHAALEWMTARGFFHAEGFAIPEVNVTFAATRAEKIAVIRALGVNVFIDDLPEVLKDAEFPESVMGILFTGGAETLGCYPRAYANWREITAMVFG